MNSPPAELCDDVVMQQVLQAAGAEPEGGLAAIEAALADCPGDPRLHFLKGSLLIGQKRFVGAHRSMSRALEISPDYHLARFQLGFFELTSGEPDAALQTWLPLDVLPAGHWIRLFVEGLRHLAHDRFAECMASLREGIAANAENDPLNGDMLLIIEECEKLGGTTGGIAKDSEDVEEVSATSFLLGSPGGGARG